MIIRVLLIMFGVIAYVVPDMLIVPDESAGEAESDDGNQSHLLVAGSAA
jgi:hypothetical protein